METIKDQAFKAFDLLSEKEQSLIFELIKSLTDDIATPEDIAAYNAAMEEYRRGECVRLEDIDLT